MRKDKKPVFHDIELRRDSSSEVSGFHRQAQKRRKFQDSSAPLVILAVALVLVFFLSSALLVSTAGGSHPFAQLLELSQDKLRRFLRFVAGQGAEGDIQFVFYRYVMIALCGASLAASGAVYQGTFRNILASPTTLGVQSGGSLGNVLYVLFFVSDGAATIRYSADANLVEQSTLLSRNLQQFLVLLGCFAAVFLVVGLTLVIGKGKFNSSSLILSGVIFSSVVGSFTMLVQYYLLETSPDTTRVDIIRNLSMGSFDRAYTLEHLGLMSLFLLPCAAVLLLMSGRMNLLVLGEDEARTMGLNVTLYRNAMILLNTVMTAVVIAFCGQIGFIGFIVPQAARRLVGPDYRRLLPACMLLGGVLLILVYDLALLLNLTAYINLLTSTLGSALMIAALFRGRGVSRDAAV